MTTPTFVIKPSKFGRPISFRELWAFRYLFGMMALRDVRVKYKQTSLGLVWVLLQPLGMMLIYTYLFRSVAKVDTAGVPYPVFVMPGLILWFLFSRSVGEGGSSLAGNVGLMSKVYFPRIMLPAAAMVGHLVDFGVSLVLVVALMGFYGHVPALTLMFAPIFLFLTVVLAFGLALWMSSLDAQVRDVRFVLPYVLQIWMFVTPVVYPLSAIPENYRWVVALNPLAPLVEGFRWSVLGLGAPPSLWGVAVSAVAGVLLVITGASYFRVTERTLIDTI
jgi:lipopolysaccharide transport system permease protein